MTTGERRFRTGTLMLHAMLSFEPFTLKDIGSPQVFQTGETFNGEPLIDYQHPHDLYSTLNVANARAFGPWTLTTTAAAVGAPALGPPPFMHRPSAAENPQSPLGHHHFDSLHITPGVLTVGVARAGMALETSWFHGREPDEDRADIDFGALDSWVDARIVAAGTMARAAVRPARQRTGSAEPGRYDARDGIGRPLAQWAHFHGTAGGMRTQPGSARQLQRVSLRKQRDMARQEPPVLAR
jgi:hypothetical protein